MEVLDRGQVFFCVDYQNTVIRLIKVYLHVSLFLFRSAIAIVAHFPWRQVGYQQTEE